MGFKGKARKCPIGTVSVCLMKNNVGKLSLYESNVENGKAKHFGGLFLVYVVTFPVNFQIVCEFVSMVSTRTV